MSHSSKCQTCERGRSWPENSLFDRNPCKKMSGNRIGKKLIDFQYYCNTYILISLKKETKHYSSLSNKRTGPNKRTGWNFDKNQISVQNGILIKMLECTRVQGKNWQFYS